MFVIDDNDITRSVLKQAVYYEENRAGVKAAPGWFVLGSANDLVFYWYIFAIWSVPELVIGRLLQTLTSILADGSEELDRRRIGVGEFCKRVDLVRISYFKLSKVDG